MVVKIGLQKVVALPHKRALKRVVNLPPLPNFSYQDNRIIQILSSLENPA